MKKYDFSSKGMDIDFENIKDMRERKRKKAKAKEKMAANKAKAEKRVSDKMQESMNKKKKPYSFKLSNGNSGMME